MPLPFIFLLCLLISAGSYAKGPQRVTVGFYNVENLFDTIPSADYDDRDYIPQSRNNWNAQRYMAKINNIARVLDDMALDIVGLAEVEGEGVVRDIVMALRTDYNYIWQSSGDGRGMDMALLYKGDRFVPDHVRQVGSAARRRPLYVRGELMGERVDIVICHMPSMLNTNGYRRAAMNSLYGFVERLHRDDRDSRLIVMGDFNSTPTDRLMRKVFHSGRQPLDGSGFLFNPLADDSRRGFGTYVYDDRWLLYDNIMLDIGFISGGRLRYRRAGIFIRDYLLEGGDSRRRGYPLRTFSSGRYTGGFSDHLPVYLELDYLTE